MISVGIKELKDKLSGYVDKVRHGEEIVVTDRGKEIALVIPISRERSAVKELVGSGRAAWTGGISMPGSTLRRCFSAFSISALTSKSGRPIPS